MEEFWDHRYSHEDYAYGTKPNEFFKSQIDQLRPGKILLPAEGEGRNAVYAAMKGWEVFAFDISEEGKRKAEKLAVRVDVKITYQIAGFEDIEYEENYFDVIALVCVHLPGNLRRPYHHKIQNYLKIDGHLLLEGFSKSQYKRTTGGPKNPEMLFSIDELRKDFSLIKNARILEEEVMLNEGDYHQGMASVIRFVGKKRKATSKVPEETQKGFG